jgi:hypothetical protein
VPPDQRPAQHEPAQQVTVATRQSPSPPCPCDARAEKATPPIQLNSTQREPARHNRHQRRNPPDPRLRSQFRQANQPPPKHTEPTAGTRQLAGRFPVSPAQPPLGIGSRPPHETTAPAQGKLYVYIVASHPSSFAPSIEMATATNN